MFVAHNSSEIEIIILRSIGPFSVFFFFFISVLPVFQRIRAEFDEFEKLFGRYLQESGHAIMWDKIRLVSDDLVSILITIQIMYIKNNVDLDFFLN